MSGRNRASRTRSRVGPTSRTPERRRPGGLSRPSGADLLAAGRGRRGTQPAQRGTMGTMRIVAPVLVLLALAVSACVPATGGQGRSVASCPPVFFGVAGSGQGLQNPPPARRPGSVSRADANRDGTTGGVLKTQLAPPPGPRRAAPPADHPP